VQGRCREGAEEVQRRCREGAGKEQRRCIEGVHHCKPENLNVRWPLVGLAPGTGSLYASVLGALVSTWLDALASTALLVGAVVGARVVLAARALCAWLLGALGRTLLDALGTVLLVGAVAGAWVALAAWWAAPGSRTSSTTPGPLLVEAERGAA
jgi:hypothetical protein